MNKNNEFSEKLLTIKNEIINRIKTILSERGIDSINFYPYWSERNCDRYLFYTVDDDGYGIALYIDKMRTDSTGHLYFEMMDLNDSPITEWEWDDFHTSDTNFLYEQILSVIEEADEKDGGRVLTADEEFDDWEDNE